MPPRCVLVREEFNHAFAALSPEEQRRRALTAISRPLQGASLEDAVDAEIVASYAERVRAAAGEESPVAPAAPPRTIAGEEMAKMPEGGNG